MAQLKDLIVNGATRLLNGLNVSGSIKQNSEQVVTKVNNIAPDASGHLSVSIPTVNNATLTINQNNTSKGTFTANSSTNTTINLTDTTYSSKTASSGGTDVSLVTTGEKYTWNNKGTYSKPSGGIPKTDLASAVQTSLGKADTALQSHQDISGKENISNKVTSWSTTTTDAHYPSEKLVKTALDGKANTSHTQAASTITGLATVATSGSYNDLSNKPTIPTVPNATGNNSATPTAAASGGAYKFTGTAATSGSPSGTATNVLTGVATAGSPPTLGTAIAADDITAWSAGSGSASLTLSGGGDTVATASTVTLSFSHSHTAPSLSYTARSIPNVTAVGAMPTFNTGTAANASHTHSVTATGSVSVTTNPTITLSNTTHTHTIS